MTGDTYKFLSGNFIRFLRYFILQIIGMLSRKLLEASTGHP
jgi:hypothetical protein